MSQKTKRTLSGAGTPERAAETGTTYEMASASIAYDTTANGGGQRLISGLLMHGASNGLHIGELVQLTGISGRDLRRRIQTERLKGIPILSDNASGYFLPANDGERRRFILSMRGRAREILAVASAVDTENTFDVGGEMSEISPDFLRQVEDDCGGK